MKFESTGLSVKEEKIKTIFSTWLPWLSSSDSDWNDFSFFDLQVALIIPIKLQVN